MDMSLLIAIIGSAFTIVASMLALFLWLRSESNNDRRDFYSVMREINRSIEEIKIENKDFHYRLLEIEKSKRHT